RGDGAHGGGAGPRRRQLRPRRPRPPRRLRRARGRRHRPAALPPRGHGPLRRAPRRAQPPRGAHVPPPRERPSPRRPRGARRARARAHRAAPHAHPQKAHPPRAARRDPPSQDRGETMTATVVPVEPVSAATSEVDPASRERVAAMVTEFLDARCPVTYNWTYRTSRADLRALYEKAKGEQWDGRTYLPWDTHVDPTEDQVPDSTIAIFGTHLWNKLDKKGIGELRQHMQSWTLSNFMHGEQGALLATAQIVTTVPWTDAKFYAATQVMDEARHVEVYERYLREKIQLTYDINEHLRALLDQILSDPRWD